MTRAGAGDVLAAVLDPGSFSPWPAQEWQLGLPRGTVDPDYARELAAARRVSGTDEAIVVGEGRLAGRRVAVLVSEFAFLAGSIGTEAANQIVCGVRRATHEGLPLLAAPASGGTRMQEGTAAFLGMRDIAAAISAHRSAGLPYLVWVRDPTFGGAFASWGSLGQVTAAEPGAALGFLGPRVYEALHGAEFPPGVQRAENLQAHGLVDAVIPLERLRMRADRVLGLICPAAQRSPVRLPAADRIEHVDAWQAVLSTRRPDRPGVRDVLALTGTELVELSGTGYGEVGAATVFGLVRFGSTSGVLLGQDRHAQRSGHLIRPADLRVARRAIRLAGELRLPLVTMVDSPGAELSRGAEEGGLAAEIAGCLADLSALVTPTLCVLLGEGAGGAAIALSATRRVIAAAHGWLAPLPPEGASAILCRTTAKAQEMAAQHGIDSASLAAAGFVHRIVDERPDAADEPAEFARRLVDTIAAELEALQPAG